MGCSATLWLATCATTSRGSPRGVTSPETSGELVQLAPSVGDVLLALVAFWLPASGIFITLCLREWRRLRREVRDLKQEIGGYAADGYPPPGPPTTDQPPGSEA